MNNGTSMVDVVFEYLSVINFSMQQNHVPVIRKLLIKNNTDNDLTDVHVEITAEPEFAVAWSNKIDRIEMQGGFDVGALDISLSTKFLSELTETITGSFTLMVASGQEVLFRQVYRVDALAYDQWSGVSILPEMLCAFVTPNHGEIPQIIRRAAIILERWTGNPSFDEYQTKNPDRVRKQMAAIYEAIAEKKLIYCTAPASFEETGQRIRIADNIFSGQIGNCLDLSLLYASCLEAVGINPLLVITKGHAFAGGWLVNDCFPDSVNDDPSLITKRAADGINEIAVVEATCMNAGKQNSFDEAVRFAGNHFVKADDFILFIDVKRARFGGIRPLPLRTRTHDGWVITEEVQQERASDKPADIVAGPRVVHADNIEVSKQHMWERKLLDLSLRNTLLNLRITRNTVQLISPDPGRLESCLVAGDEFQVLPRPADWDNPLRSAGVYQSVNSSDPIMDLVKHELTQKRLRAYLSEVELANSLLSLYRASRLSQEESGANILYVTLGLLRWYETDRSEVPRFAPILLLPVEIIRKTARKGYIIRSREEDAILNVTLLEMIRHDFGIEIGGLEILPKDEGATNVKRIFSIIRQAVMSRPRWDVEEQAFLGTFSFSKFIMWNDIHSNAEKLGRHKIIASLISGQMFPGQQRNDTGDTGLDTRYHPSEIALPISADSSQLEAICAAAEDSSFVLHGPPGTGKSQTITNIIANSLYKGKKVLFVAEKMAALSVVKSRLEAIGLGSFCLELHSNKAKKSAVLEQLKKTIEIARTRPSQMFGYEADRLHSLRTELNDYVEALHKTYPFGRSLFDIFTDYVHVKDAPDTFSFKEEAIRALTQEGASKWNDLAEELQAAGTVCDHPHNHPLELIQLKQYTQAARNEAKELLAVYIDDLKEYEAVTAELLRKLMIDIGLSKRQQFIQLHIICDLLVSLPDTPAGLFAADNMEQTLGRLTELAEHGEKETNCGTPCCRLLTKLYLPVMPNPCYRNGMPVLTSGFLRGYLNEIR